MEISGRHSTYYPLSSADKFTNKIERESTMLDLLLQLDDEVIDDLAELELEILEEWNDRR